MNTLLASMSRQVVECAADCCESEAAAILEALSTMDPLARGFEKLPNPRPSFERQANAGSRRNLFLMFVRSN